MVECWICSSQPSIIRTNQNAIGIWVTMVFWFNAKSTFMFAQNLSKFSWRSPLTAQSCIFTRSTVRSTFVRQSTFGRVNVVHSNWICLIDWLQCFSIARYGCINGGGFSGKRYQDWCTLCTSSSRNGSFWRNLNHLHVWPNDRVSFNDKQPKIA